MLHARSEAMPSRDESPRPVPRIAANPAQELQRMLERHYGPRADLPAPSQSRLVALVDPIIVQASRLAGPVLFAAGLIVIAAMVFVR